MKELKEGGVDGRQGGVRGHTEGRADLPLKNQATATCRECLMPRPPQLRTAINAAGLARFLPDGLGSTHLCV